MTSSAPGEYEPVSQVADGDEESAPLLPAQNTQTQTKESYRATYRRVTRHPLVIAGASSVFAAGSCLLAASHSALFHEAPCSHVPEDSIIKWRPVDDDLSRTTRYFPEFTIITIHDKDTGNSKLEDVVVAEDGESFYRDSRPKRHHQMPDVHLILQRLRVTPRPASER